MGSPNLGFSPSTLKESMLMAWGFLPLHFITAFKSLTTLNLEISFCKKEKKSIYLKLAKNINTPLNYYKYIL